MLRFRSTTVVLLWGGVLFGAHTAPASAQKIYWTQASGVDGKIRRSNLDGSNIEDLVSCVLIVPSGIAPDSGSGFLYWIDSNTVQRAGLNIPVGETACTRSDIETLAMGAPGKHLHDVVLDTCRGLMFYTEGVADPTANLYCANLNGTDARAIVTLDTGFSAGFVALDSCSGKVYWIAGGPTFSFKIQRANLDGSTVEDLVTGAGNAIRDLQLDVFSGKMYWTDGTAGARKIRRANLEIPIGETPSARTDIEDLVCPPVAGSNTEIPYALVLDLDSARMYWSDGGTLAIYSASMNIPAGQTCDNRSDIVQPAPWTGFGASALAFESTACADCNGNKLPDECDIANCTGDPVCSDCNANGIPDECDIRDCPPQHLSCQDCNGNNLPDECEVVVQDSRLFPDPWVLEAGDNSGQAVAIDGDTVAIGAPRHDYDALAGISGAVFVFEREGGNWSLRARLRPDGTNVGATQIGSFGQAVAIEGDTLVVGAPGQLTPVDPTRKVGGAAYVFSRGTNQQWDDGSVDQAAVFVIDDMLNVVPPPGGGIDSANVGAAVAIDGGTIAVGAPFLPDATQTTGTPGYVFIFRKDHGGNASSWESGIVDRVATIQSANGLGGDEFGYDLGISGTTLIVGAPRRHGPPSGGFAFAFDRRVGPSPDWDGSSLDLEGALVPTDSNGFGYAVAAGGNEAVVGAPNLGSPTSTTGAVWVFERQNGVWSLQAMLTGCDIGAGDQIGGRVAIDQGTILATAHTYDWVTNPGPGYSGSAYLFRRGANGLWDDGCQDEMAKVFPEVPMFADLFAGSSAISGNTVVIGAPDYDNGALVDTGASFVHSIVADCNANGIPDECDIANCRPENSSCADCDGDGVPNECELPPICATCVDCNNNGVPDDCDLDCAHNGVPDNCECLPVFSAGPEAVVIAKNRYISFTPGNGCLRTAIRVTLADLPHPFDQQPPPNGFEGVNMWVGAPRAVSELAAKSDGTPPTFSAAELQCSPHYDDWGPWGTLHVSSDAIVPAARYEVQLVHEGCNAGNEANYSAALSVATSCKWCDVVDPICIMNFQDIAALVDKFKDSAGAPIKARSDLLPNVPDRLMTFLELSTAVAAFQGRPFPFAGPPGCP